MSEQQLISKDQALYAARELQNPYLSQQFAQAILFLLFLPFNLLDKTADLILALKEAFRPKTTWKQTGSRILVELTTLKPIDCHTAVSEYLHYRVQTAKPWAKLIIRSLGICGFIFASELLIPWNLLDASHKATQDYLYRVAAPLFPHGKTEAEKLAPLVVMLTDKDQRSLEEDGYPESWTQWPPDAALYAEMLDYLLSANPAAVFFDVGFLTDRKSSDICALVEVISRQTDDRKKVPIFLAGDFSESRPLALGMEINCDGNIIDSGSRFDSMLEPALAFEIMPQLLEAGAKTVSVRQTPTHYMLYDCAARRPSAALALYSALRRYHFSSEELEEYFCINNEKQNWQGQPHNQMSVYWSNRPVKSGPDPYYDPLSLERTFLQPFKNITPDYISTPRGNAQKNEEEPVAVTAAAKATSGARETWFEPYIQPYPCLALPGSFLTSVFYPVLNQLGLVGEGRLLGEISNKQTCPPYNTLSAHTVLSSAEFDVAGSPMHALVQHRAVLIGADFRMGNDLSLPPTHQRVPGVYRHAMALENLERVKPIYLEANPCFMPGDTRGKETEKSERAPPRLLESEGCSYLRRAPEIGGIDLGVAYRVASTFILSLTVNFVLLGIGGYCQAKVAPNEATTEEPKEPESCSQCAVCTACRMVVNLINWVFQRLSQGVTQFGILLVTWLRDLTTRLPRPQTSLMTVLVHPFVTLKHTAKSLFESVHPAHLRVNIYFNLVSLLCLVAFSLIWAISLLFMVFVLNWEPETLVDTILLLTFGTAINIAPFLRARGSTIAYVKRFG